MDINCPYCGSHYELDESLIPEGNVNVKCRICSNVFTLNKKTGVIHKDTAEFSGKTGEKKDEPTNSESVEAALNKLPNESGKVDTQTESLNASDVQDDFMKTVISEINSAVAEERDKPTAAKDSRVEKDIKEKKVQNKIKSVKKKGASPFQISMAILLAIVFLIAVFSLLIRYGIINVGFLPPVLSDLLSSF